MSSLFRDASAPALSRRERRERGASDAEPRTSPSEPSQFGTKSLFGPDPDEVDTHDEPTILTVCTGNICRSPLAEVLLRAQLERLGVRVHSAGTHALVGHKMTDPAQAIAVERGADASAAAEHRARYLVEPLLFESDLILTMTVEHREHVVRMAPKVMKRTFTVPEFARLAEGLDAASVRSIVAASPAARLRAAAVLVNDRRTQSAASQGSDDVTDPYRQSRAVYTQSADQIAPGLSEVQRIVTAALR